MGKEVMYKCDAPNCKAVRGNLNHWFFYEQKNDWLSFAPLENCESLLDEEVGYAIRGCVCSRGCAQKVFEIFLCSCLASVGKQPGDEDIDTKVVMQQFDGLISDITKITK